MSQNSQQPSIKDKFREINPLKVSERVAESIRNAIVRGTFKPGEHLPPERQLATRFGVTRNTVREALRRLEQLRLIRVRHGSGVRVLDYLENTGLDFLVSLIASPQQGSAELMRDLLEARALLSTAIGAHAVEHLDLDAIDELVEAVEAFAAEAALARPDVPTLQRLDFEVHDQLVRAGGNRALVLLYNSLRHIYEQVAHRFEGLIAAPHQMAERYREAIEALEAGDRTQAKEIFTEVFAHPPGLDD